MHRLAVGVLPHVLRHFDTCLHVGKRTAIIRIQHTSIISLLLTEHGQTLSAFERNDSVSPAEL